MSDLVQDLRYALRSIGKRPALSVAVVATLGLAIGANSALFSVVNGVLLRPPPFEQPDRVVMLHESDRISGTDREAASVPDYYDLRARSRSFEELAAFAAAPVNLVDGAGGPVQLTSVAASHTLFPMLGVRLRLGRSFRPGEDMPGGDQVAVLSEELWRTRFGADPGILGHTLRLDDSVFTVIGVAPSGVVLPGHLADVWLPLRLGPASTPRTLHNVFVAGRLRPGIALPAARAEVSQIARQLEREYPNANHGRTVTVEGLEEVQVGPVRPALLILLGAVGLLLLVACSNVASLLLARGWARRHEIAVRRALGASTGRLGRQFLVESLVLTLMGAALGVVLAGFGVDLLLKLAPQDLPRLDAVQVDGRVVLATLALALGVATVFGLLPTLQARRVDANLATQADGGRALSTGTERRRLRDALVIAEVGLSVLLVIGAGLLLRSFWKLQSVDPGFRTEHIVKLNLRLPGARYPQNFQDFPQWTEVSNFYGALLERAAAVPGVATVALAIHQPLAPGFTNSFVIEGREAEASTQPEIPIRPVSPGYFATLGVPLRRGRALEQRDRVDAPAVVVINQAAARRFFPHDDPVGHRLSFWGTSREIVGVVGNERFHGLAEDAPPAVYPPLAQVPLGFASLLVRTQGEPESIIPGLRQAVWSLDPQLALFGVERLERTLADSVARPRFTTLLLGLFAALALLLASVGIHGLLSYTVVQRTREIGIRMAMGASRRDVLEAVISRGLTLATAGIALGLIGALGLSRLLRSLLFGVTPTDPTIFLLTPLLLGTVALFAALLPALRAARTDPMIALRSE